MPLNCEFRVSASSCEEGSGLKPHFGLPLAPRMNAGLPPTEAQRLMIELMANFAPSMFAGHSMLCPYKHKGEESLEFPFSHACFGSRGAVTSDDRRGLSGWLSH